jgi:hypothetical protein
VGGPKHHPRQRGRFAAAADPAIGGRARVRGSLCGMRTWCGILLVALVATGCGRDRPAERRPPADADGSGSPLTDRPRDAALPPAHPDSFAAPPLTALRIAAPARRDAVPLPDAPPAEPPPPAGATDRLPLDETLRPPILRGGTRLALPGHARGWIELDVLVDANGGVADVRAAAGTADTATVRAAFAAARSLRYLPARQAGRAVAVWCRQRFDSGR